MILTIQTLAWLSLLSPERWYRRQCVCRTANLVGQLWCCLNGSLSWWAVIRAVGDEILTDSVLYRPVATRRGFSDCRVVFGVWLQNACCSVFLCEFLFFIQCMSVRDYEWVWGFNLSAVSSTVQLHGLKLLFMFDLHFYSESFQESQQSISLFFIYSLHRVLRHFWSCYPTVKQGDRYGAIYCCFAREQIKLFKKKHSFNAAI